MSTVTSPSFGRICSDLTTLASNGCKNFAGTLYGAGRWTISVIKSGSSKLYSNYLYPCASAIAALAKKALSSGRALISGNPVIAAVTIGASCLGIGYLLNKDSK